MLSVSCSVLIIDEVYCADILGHWCYIVDIDRCILCSAPNIYNTRMKIILSVLTVHIHDIMTCALLVIRNGLSGRIQNRILFTCYVYQEETLLTISLSLH
jgi:hypothetical protein